MYGAGIYTSAYIEVEFPSDFKIVTCGSCSLLSPVRVSVALSPLSGSIGPITVVNPNTISISTNILVRLYLDGSLSISHTYTALKTFTAHSIQFAVAGSHTYLGEEGSQLVNITENILTEVESITIAVPSEYQIRSSGGVVVSASYSEASINIVSAGTTLNEVVISNIPSLSSLSVNIVGLLNPSASPGTNSWGVVFKSSSNVVMAQSTTSVVFSATCSSPCRSCTSDVSSCLTCYNVSGSPFPYLQQSQCLPACSSNYF